MTDIEAIKNLKELIDLSKEEIENNDKNTTAILDITDLKSLAIVLKSLEQKDKEIKELKEKWNKDTHTLQNQLDLANADRVEKDKIIDLMAEYIADEDTSTFICGDKIGCDEDCVECVLDFFQKKAREENE